MIDLEAERRAEEQRMNAKRIANFRFKCEVRNLLQVHLLKGTVTGIRIDMIDNTGKETEAHLEGHIYGCL